MKTKTVKSGKHFETDITTDRSGRTSILIYDSDSARYQQKPIADIELPCQEGEYKDAFKPIVKVREGIEIARV